MGYIINGVYPASRSSDGMAIMEIAVHENKYNFNRRQPDMQQAPRIMPMAVLKNGADQRI